MDKTFTGKVKFCGLTVAEILALKEFYLKHTGRPAETILDKHDPLEHIDREHPHGCDGDW